MLPGARLTVSRSGGMNGDDWYVRSAARRSTSSVGRAQRERMSGGSGRGLRSEAEYWRSSILDSTRLTLFAASGSSAPARGGSRGRGLPDAPSLSTCGSFPTEL